MDHMNSFVRKGRPLSVNMRNNPFSCDCRSTQFLEWVVSSGVKLDQVEDYICHDGFPPENIDKPLNSVS